MFDMETEFLKTLGQIAGIGGLSLGIFFILFKEIIRKNIFPSLKKDHAYLLIRLIIVLIWSVAIIGILAWVFVLYTRNDMSTSKINDNSMMQVTYGDKSPAIKNTNGDVVIKIKELDEN